MELFFDINSPFSLMGLSGVIILVLQSLVLFYKGITTPQLTYEEKPTEKKEQGEKTVASVEEVKLVEKTVEAKPEKSWASRVSNGLEKTRSAVWGRLFSIVSKGEMNEEALEEIEEILFSADLPPVLAQEIFDDLKMSLSGQGEVNIKEMLSSIKEKLINKMIPVQVKLDEPQTLISKIKTPISDSSQKSPHVIMIVGVNGVGKTTTIGKLATRLKNMGAKVMVGACDTFRAAAVEQLETWCKRADVEIVKSKEGADPSGVAFETVQKAVESNVDYCIIDTAGRLHTKSNLMDELKKTKKVMGKVLDSSPHDVFLVIDAITGQNALRQAEEFNAALGLTGLIFTKCDGSSKAGSAIGIVDKLQVPITYIGVGEEQEDLDVFDTELYLNSLLGINSSTDLNPTSITP
ncbi:signal recognition particle-docking protein FtsY [Bacteriovoracaceae bacterium]|nr:signal recognition particle-docking protein FtsY [Bacteriovoracaceae bacterium]